jgi:hypothetical protein
MTDWHDVIIEMASRFTSLNEIPVERASIKCEEWLAILELINALDADAVGIQAELESYKLVVSSALDDVAIRDHEIDRLERERAAAIDRLMPLGLEIERLRALLLESKRSHVVCEDCWYSCPASGECCKPDHGGKCDCGADEWNAKVDIALTDAVFGLEQNATPGATLTGEDSVRQVAESSRPQGLQLTELADIPADPRTTQEDTLSPYWNEACEWAAQYCREMFNKEWHDNSIAGEYMAARNGYIGAREATAK